MRYYQLTESVMHVPDALRLPVLAVVTSAVCGILKNRADNIPQETEDGQPNPAHKDIERVINTYMNKYHAKVMSKEQLDELKNRPLNLSINAQKFVDQLQNMKLTDEQESKIRELLNKPVLLKLMQYNGSTAGSYKRYGGDGNHHSSTIEIAIFGRDVRDPAAMARSVIAVVDHELQHFMQYNVLQVLNKNDKQFNASDTPQTDDVQYNYLNSRIEFSPHIKNILSEFETTVLEKKLHGELDVDNSSKFITSTLKDIVAKSPHYRRFIMDVKNHSEDNWKKIWTTLASKAGKFLDEVLKSTETDDTVLYSIGDLSSEQIEARVNVMKAVMDDLQEEGIKISVRGRNVGEIKEISIAHKDCIVDIEHTGHSKYTVQGAYRTSTNTMKAHAVLDAQQLLKFINTTYKMYRNEDPSNVLQNINSFGDPRNLTDNDLSYIQENFDEVAAMFGSAPAISHLDGNTLTLTIDGVEMKLKVESGSVEMECEDPFMYFRFAERQSSMFFQYILRSMNADKDATLEVLTNSITPMEAMFEMAKIIGL